MLLYLYVTLSNPRFYLYPAGFQGFQGTTDPEELFRKIFGDMGFNMSGFGNQADFEESKYGFAPASEVSGRMC